MTTATTPSTMPEEWDRRLTSRAERYAAGKALRSKAPHSSHAAQRSRGIGTRAVPGISSYLGNRGTFDQAIASFVEVYADQAALLAAIKEGAQRFASYRKRRSQTSTSLCVG